MRASCSMRNLQPAECPTLVHAVLAFLVSLQLYGHVLHQPLAAAGLPCSFPILRCHTRLWLAAGASMHLTQKSKPDARPGQLFRVARLDSEASMLNERRLQAGDCQQLLHLPKPVQLGCSGPVGLTLPAAEPNEHLLAGRLMLTHCWFFHSSGRCCTCQHPPGQGC